MRRMNTQKALRYADRSLESYVPTCAHEDRAPFAVPALAWTLLAWVLAALFAASSLVSPAFAEPPTGSPESERAFVEPAPAAPSFQGMERQEMERLLSVPTALADRDASHATDEAIAAAVRLGNADRFVHKSGFRKRNLDLFRTERSVEIANQEMLLRLRLRAAKRETMSVELRF